MKRRIVNFAAEVFVWTLLSAFVEVAVTATVERWSLGDRYVLRGVPAISLQGHSTIWVVISGALLTLGLRGMMALLDRLRAFDRVLDRWYLRAPIVMIAIFAVEYVAGLVFNKGLGWQLWDYSQYVWHGVPLHLQGQITLVYAPFYFTAGVFLRPVYRMVHSLAPYLGHDVIGFIDHSSRRR